MPGPLDRDGGVLLTIQITNDGLEPDDIQIVGACEVTETGFQTTENAQSWLTVTSAASVPSPIQVSRAREVREDGFVMQHAMRVTTSNPLSGSATGVGYFGQAICAHDCQYFLQCATELLEITPDVYAFAESVGRFNMNAFLDEYPFDTSPGTIAINKHLRRIFLDWHSNRASDLDRAEVGMEFAVGLRYQLDEFLTTISDEAAITASRRDSNRTMEEILGDPDFLEETIRGWRNMGDWLEAAGESWRLAEAAYLAVHKPALLRQIKQRREARHSCLSEGTYVAGVHDGGIVLTETRRRSRSRPPPDRKKQKITRNSLKRSLNLLNTILGEAETRDFLAGKPVRVEGTLFDFVFTKSPHLDLLHYTEQPSNAHIPYRFAISNKAGAHLANGCVVFQNTPVLDQVAAAVLHIVSQEELTLLEKTNLSGKSDAYFTDPDLMALGLVRDGQYNFVDGNLIRVCPDPMNRGLSNDEWRERIVVWRPRLRAPLVEVLGRITGIGPVLSRISDSLLHMDEFVYRQQITAPTLSELFN
jgi:hypothetical protein